MASLLEKLKSVNISDSKALQIALAPPASKL